MNANASPLKKKEDKTKEKDSVIFWGEDPNVLFNTAYIFEFYPTQTMTYNQQLNSLSRTIIVLTIVSFIFSQSKTLLVISMITLASIYFLHKSQMEDNTREKFTTPAKDYITSNGGVIPTDLFQEPSSTNPFSNILVTDIGDNPQRKPAPYSGNPVVRDEILIKAKQMVEASNSEQPDIVNKLFKDVNEQLSFEQSMRQFHSASISTIPNDQAGFLDFCYGNMGSNCRDGNLFACSRNTSHYNLY